ncbi:MAG: hypothetical protein ACI4DY_14850 [Monoglobaceae bacterium]
MDDLNSLNLFDNEKNEEVKSDLGEEFVDENTMVPEESVEELTKESSNEAETVSEENTENEEIVEDLSENSQEESEPLPEIVEPELDKYDKVLENQQQILESINALNALFNKRIMHTDHEEKIVDRMHKELQKYKEDMYAQLVRPILLDVIEVRDSIMRMAAAYLEKPEGEQSIPNKTFSDYSYDLQDILEKNNVEIYRSKTGDAFTPIKQRAVKKVITADENLHGKVAESLSCGYSYNGRIISAEKIAVYYYEKPVQKNENNENSEVIENG